MRNLPLTKNNFYHIYNRGSLKQTIFYEPSDYTRFLFSLLFFQTNRSVPNVKREVAYFLKNKKFNASLEKIANEKEGRVISLVNFCLMPNHFHLTLYSHTDNGISQYMHRVGNAYAKYFNEKYDQSGHVFQGTYKAKIIQSENQLDYLSAYIHLNPSELPTWKNKERAYLWSSLQDYEHNRWGENLQPQRVMQRFNNFQDYHSYIYESGAKSTPSDE